MMRRREEEDVNRNTRRCSGRITIVIISEQDMENEESGVSDVEPRSNGSPERRRPLTLLRIPLPRGTVKAY